MTIRERIARELGIDLAVKENIYAQVYRSAEIANLSYWSEVVLSAGIATLGLVQNSPAVIIGAMLISPLMGPILSTGLALAIGDSYLLLKSVLNVVLSIVVSTGLAGLLVWLLPFHTVTQEILSRIHPNLLDLGIAILSGVAGSIVVCRGGSGNSVMALPGVAIAVALMPPLSVIGFGIGSSFNREIMYGASLLFLTNLIAIISSAFAVFLLVGMNTSAQRSHEGNSTAERAEEDRLYRILQNSPLQKLVNLQGSLHWRMLLLLIFLAIVFFPLRAGLIQVKNEAIARGAVQDALRGLMPSDTLVAQNVHYRPHNVEISIMSAKPVSADSIENAQRLIERRTGGTANITVQEVASRSELFDLLDKVHRQPPASVTKPPVITTLESDVLKQMKPVIEELWPSDTPLRSWELGFSPDGPVLHLRYEAKVTLNSFSISLLQQAMRSRLELPNLVIDAKRMRPIRQHRSTKPRQ